MKNKFLILFSVLILTACTPDLPKAPIDSTDRSLSCVPDKPLSKGELYARGMQDYFKRKIHSILHEAEYEYKINYERFFFDTKEIQYKDACHVIADSQGFLTFNSKDCFPYQIKSYDTYDKLKQWHQHGEIFHNPKDLIKHWQGTVFDPQQEIIYKTEWYNRVADFAVIQRVGPKLHFYPNDCCKLVNFDELKQEELKKKKSEFSGYDFSSIIYNERKYKETYFLKIMRLELDETSPFDLYNFSYIDRPQSKEFLQHINKEYEMGSFYVMLNRCGYTLDDSDFFSY